MCFFIESIQLERPSKTFTDTSYPTTMTHSSGEADLKVKNLFSFENHVALVTGGATGIGEMAAQGFVQNGARVFIASRKESELKAVCLATVLQAGFTSMANGNDA